MGGMHRIIVTNDTPRVCETFKLILVIALHILLVSWRVVYRCGPIVGHVTPVTVSYSTWYRSTGPSSTCTLFASEQNGHKHYRWLVVTPSKRDTYDDGRGRNVKNAYTNNAHDNKPRS